MEEQILFIQYQIWGVIVLLIIFVVGNVFCYLTRTKERKLSPEFGDLWDKGKIEELLSESESYLKEYPNYSSALYFRAKALISCKRFDEAKNCIEILILNHPDLKEEVSILLETIESKG